MAVLMASVSASELAICDTDTWHSDEALVSMAMKLYSANDCYPLQTFASSLARLLHHRRRQPPPPPPRHHHHYPITNISAPERTDVKQPENTRLGFYHPASLFHLHCCGTQILEVHGTF